jgi:hypothetical protein
MSQASQEPIDIKKDEIPQAAQPQPAPSSPIPNGGFKAWLQVLGAHLLFFNSWYVKERHLTTASTQRGLS